MIMMLLINSIFHLVQHQTKIFHDLLIFSSLNPTNQMVAKIKKTKHCTEKEEITHAVISTMIFSHTNGIAKETDTSIAQEMQKHFSSQNTTYQTPLCFVATKISYFS